MPGGHCAYKGLMGWLVMSHVLFARPFYTNIFMTSLNIELLTPPERDLEGETLEKHVLGTRGHSADTR
jgi:hypothetical protein